MSTPPLSLKELLAQKAELEQRIAETQRAEREQAIAQIRRLMNEYGLTPADLGGHTRVGTPMRVKGPGSTVAPKYRHPGTGETWSGRGLQPRWLREALASGRSLAEFTL